MTKLNLITLIVVTLFSSCTPLMERKVNADDFESLVNHLAADTTKGQKEIRYILREIHQEAKDVTIWKKDLREADSWRRKERLQGYLDNRRTFQESVDKHSTYFLKRRKKESLQLKYYQFMNSFITPRSVKHRITWNHQWVDDILVNLSINTNAEQFTPEIKRVNFLCRIECSKEFGSILGGTLLHKFYNLTEYSKEDKFFNLKETKLEEYGTSYLWRPFIKLSKSERNSKLLSWFQVRIFELELFNGDIYKNKEPDFVFLEKEDLENYIH